MMDRGVGPNKFESASSEQQRSELIQSYGGLYTQSRVETLDWLDKLDELRGAEELKSKLLFSVIVVSHVIIITRIVIIQRVYLKTNSLLTFQHNLFFLQLAFRSLQTTSAQMKDHIKRILQIPPGQSSVVHQAQLNLASVPLPPPPPPPPSVMIAPSNHRTPPAKPAKPAKRKERNPGYEVEQAVASYLRESVDTFDLTKNTEVFLHNTNLRKTFNLILLFAQDVCNQIWATLYDYPCLRTCDQLVKYIKDSVRLAWALVNQVSNLFNHKPDG